MKTRIKIFICLLGAILLSSCGYKLPNKKITPSHPRVYPNQHRDIPTNLTTEDTDHYKDSENQATE